MHFVEFRLVTVSAKHGRSWRRFRECRCSPPRRAKIPNAFVHIANFTSCCHTHIIMHQMHQNIRFSDERMLKFSVKGLNHLHKPKPFNKYAKLHYQTTPMSAAPLQILAVEFAVIIDCNGSDLTYGSSRKGSKTGYPEPFSEYYVVNALYTLCIIRVFIRQK